MIAELLAGAAGLATVAGLAVYAIRSVRVYADRALSEAEARRAADVSAANLAGDLRVADGNTAAWMRTAERERRTRRAVEEYARATRSDPILAAPDGSVDPHDRLLSALDTVAGLTPPEPLRARGGDAGAGGDRLPGAGGPAVAAGDLDAAGPATVPGE